jgi:chromosome segregation ATPase
MTDQTSSSGATPSGSETAAGATPGGQQHDANRAGATPAAGSAEGARPDAELGDAGRQALDKERDARRDAERQLAETRRRIADLEDAGKSETDRALAQLKRASDQLDASNRRIADLEGEIAKRDLDQLKAQVAREHDLPATLAARLQGTDLRSLRADAKAMQDELGSGERPGSARVGQGSGAAGGSRRVDMNQLIREAAGR